MIQLHDVTKIYRETGICALRDLNLQIQKGEFVFLIGATGAGKSTLLKLLLREEITNRGQVLVGGQDLARMKKREVPPPSSADRGGFSGFSAFA